MSPWPVSWLLQQKHYFFALHHLLLLPWLHIFCEVGVTEASRTDTPAEIIQFYRLRACFFDPQTHPSVYPFMQTWKASYKSSVSLSACVLSSGRPSSNFLHPSSHLAGGWSKLEECKWKCFGSWVRTFCRVFHQLSSCVGSKVHMSSQTTAKSWTSSTFLWKDPSAASCSTWLL